MFIECFELPCYYPKSEYCQNNRITYWMKWQTENINIGDIIMWCKNFFCTTSALALLLSLNFASAVPAAEKASSGNPWVAFNSGSWVEIKSTTVSKESGKEKTTIVGTKITLQAKTADSISLENEMTINGETTKTKFDVPLDYSYSDSEGMKVIKTGSETITIAGKPVTCDTLEATMDAGGTKILFKSWTSKKVPGSLVRSITSSDGSQSTAEVVDFKVF